MKKLIIVLCLVVFIAVLITAHAVSIQKLYRDIDGITASIEEVFSQQNWDGVKQGLEQAEKRWKESKIWASLTIDTDTIEEIEISLEQSKRYAELQDREDFIGEFVMFKMLVAHLPHREGISLEELL